MNSQKRRARHTSNRRSNQKHIDPRVQDSSPELRCKSEALITRKRLLILPLIVIMTMLKLAQNTTLPLTRLRLLRSNSVRVNPAHGRDIDWILASHGRFRRRLVCFMLAASEFRRECVRVLWDGNAVVHFLSTLLVCWEVVQGLGVG